MLRRTYLLAITAITVACILLGSYLHLGGGLRRLSPRGKEPAGTVSSLEKETVVEEGFTKIRMDVGVMDIVIKNSDRYAVTRDFSEEKLLPAVKTEGDTLIVSQSSKLADQITLKDLSGAAKSKLVIETAGPCEEIWIDLGVGDIELRELRSERLELDSGVGDVRLSDSDFDHIDIDGGTGDVKITGLKDLDRFSLSLDTGVGDIKIQGEHYPTEYQRKEGDRSMKIDLGVGDLTID